MESMAADESATANMAIVRRRNSTRCRRLFFVVAAMPSSSVIIRARGVVLNRRIYAPILGGGQINGSDTIVVGETELTAAEKEACIFYREIISGRRGGEKFVTQQISTKIKNYS